MLLPLVMFLITASTQRKDLEVEKLINTLQTVKALPGWGFYAFDLATALNGGVEETPEPTERPLKMLTRMGARALPQLLKHLSDARPTAMHVKKTAWSKVRFGSFYSARVPANSEPEELQRSDPRSEELVDEYTVTVGDLCYELVGQIVNRRLEVLSPVVAMSHQTVNSPTHTPALAAACRKDWAGVTAEEHEASLLLDLKEWNNQELMVPHIGAISRLVLYYPATGLANARRMFASPFVPGSLRDRLIHHGVSLHSTSDLRRFHEEAIQRYHFDAAVMVWGELNSDARRDQSPEAQRAKVKIEQLFGGQKPIPDPRANGADWDRFTYLAQEFESFPNQELDAPAAECFSRIAREIEPEHRDYLEVMCVSLAKRLLRFKRTTGAKEYLSFLRERHRAYAEQNITSPVVTEIRDVIKKLSAI